MDNKFPIFKTNNSIFIFTTGNLLLIAIIIITKLNEIFNSSLLLKIVGVIIFLISFLFHFTKSFRYKKLDGKFDGVLIFNEDHLMINNKKIYVDTILKIYIRTTDYDGLKWNSIKAYQFNKSNGTNNLLDIITKDNYKTKIFFQMDYMQQEYLKPFVISLLKNNIISIEQASEILHLDEDYEVFLFELELNKKALD